MRISQFFNKLDEERKPKQRKAIDYFIDNNMERLYGTAEFDDYEVYVSAKPKGIELGTIFGDEETRQIAISRVEDGVVGKSLITGAELFKISLKKDEIENSITNRNNGHNLVYICRGDEFVHLDLEMVERLSRAKFYGSLKAMGMRTKGHEYFSLDIKHPIGYSSGKMVRVPIDAYGKLDEYDYLDRIFLTLESNKKNILSFQSGKHLNYKQEHK